MRLAENSLPDSAAVRAALEVAEAYLPPPLVAHSVRSWYWAAGFAEILGLRPDGELLAVAALLHDTGLAEEFDAVRVPYETAGGHVAAVLGAGAGWDAARRRRVVEVVERHNWPEVDPALDVEGHLLEIATGLDISGARPDALPQAYLREVLAAHPRGALAAAFGDRVAEQASRKPESHAARILAGGLREHLAHHPLDAL